MLAQDLHQPRARDDPHVAAQPRLLSELNCMNWFDGFICIPRLALFSRMDPSLQTAGTMTCLLVVAPYQSVWEIPLGKISVFPLPCRPPPTSHGPSLTESSGSVWEIPPARNSSFPAPCRPPLPDLPPLPLPHQSEYPPGNVSSGGADQILKNLGKNESACKVLFERSSERFFIPLTGSSAEVCLSPTPGPRPLSARWRWRDGGAALAGTAQSGIRISVL